MSATKLRTGIVSLGLALTLGVPLAAEQPAVFQVDFTNAQQVPAHWTLKLHADGSGQFDADGGQPTAEESRQIFVSEVHRPVQLSAPFTAQVFAAARRHRLFQVACESHLKVAFQGTKRLSYSGPEGSGSCEFNYSKDKEIQALGESLVSVEATLLFGARMEKLLLHDRLGLDEELNGLTAAVQDGNALELGAIRDTLTRIANDEQVLDRDRRKALRLLAQAAPDPAGQARSLPSQ